MMCELPELVVEPATLGEPLSPRILIIDDDTEQAEVLAHAFRKQGYRTLMAGTVGLGRFLAQQQLPDLILLDIRLPDGSGLKLCQELSDEPTTSGIPVVIVSGMESARIVHEARSVGCVFYLRKPYDPNALLALAERALDRLEPW